MSFARITDQPISEFSLHTSVMSPDCGALVVFHGVVRNHDDDRGVLALEYHAHPDAERFLAECVGAEEQRTGLSLAAVHRIGQLKVGEVALIAAAASAHRGEAFAAVEQLVDRIKHEVPIWKRQEFSDGLSEWVGV
ncbi:molybdenum cofactor biosynthesis protein MoaE [Leucobacter sp. W1038]|uniref:molybdenum cofactor biosynthesis protein MoaE n=1 Tax=Leucobacter sp. W1038 TaxID=3438281 RepID=UPI003D953425